MEPSNGRSLVGIELVYVTQLVRAGLQGCPERRHVALFGLLAPVEVIPFEADATYVGHRALSG